MAAFTGAVVLAALRVADHEQAIRTDAVDADPDGERRQRAGRAAREDRRARPVHRAAGAIATPGTLTGVIAFVTGVISVYSSTSGVVLPAFLHRHDRHPVPQLPVRGRRLPRRDGRHGDRIGDGPAAVRADPPVRRVPGLRPEPDRAADAGAVVLLDRRGRGDDRQHDRARSSAYAIGAWGGRPFLERWGSYLLIRAARDRARRPVLRQVRLGHRVLQPPPADRPDVHQLPGGRRPDADRAVHRLFDGRRVPVVDRCSSGPAPSSAPTGSTSGTRSSRSTCSSSSPWSPPSCCSSGGASAVRAGVQGGREPERARSDRPRRVQPLRR